MEIIETKEIVKDDITYIVNTYDNGTIEQYIKPDPNAKPPEPEPMPEPVTLEEVKQLQLDTMQGLTDLYMMQLGGK